MTYKDIARASSSLTALSNVQFKRFEDAHLAYCFIQDIKAELDFYAAEERKIAIEHGAEISGCDLKFPSHAAEIAFAKERDTLQNHVVNIRKLAIYDSDIKNSNMTPANMMALDGIVDFKRGDRDG